MTVILSEAKNLLLFRINHLGDSSSPSAPQNDTLTDFFSNLLGAKRLRVAKWSAHVMVSFTNMKGVELTRVWAIVENDLPGLKQAIAALLPPLDQLERELAGEDETPKG